jgi:DNA (cytosine-5)-methyltransferase 1
MNHLDGFAGTGMFRLAAEYVWQEEYHCHYFIEIDPFCQKWLKANFPETPIHSDIKDYKHDGTTINLFSAGFPCPPVSIAGKGKGEKDDRWLWPETIKVIQNVKPESVLLENVDNLVNFDSGLLLDGVLSDLENEGYEVLPPIILPACSQNAPHRRYRVFIVAYTDFEGNWGRGIFRSGENKEKMDKRPSTGIIRTNQIGNVADTFNGRSQNRWIKSGGTLSKPNSKDLRSEVKKLCSIWDEYDWITGHDGKQRRIPTPESGICCLVDGYPHRNDLLRSFGNGIVWQVVVPIMEALKSANLFIPLDF